jgi:hypothetical protein
LVDQYAETAHRTQSPSPDTTFAGRCDFEFHSE